MLSRDDFMMTCVFIYMRDNTFVQTDLVNVSFINNCLYDYLRFSVYIWHPFSLLSDFENKHVIHFFVLTRQIENCWVGR